MQRRILTNCDITDVKFLLQAVFDGVLQMLQTLCDRRIRCHGLVGGFCGFCKNRDRCRAVLIAVSMIHNVTCFVVYLVCGSLNQLSTLSKSSSFLFSCFLHASHQSRVTISRLSLSTSRHSGCTHTRVCDLV